MWESVATEVIIEARSADELQRRNRRMQHFGLESEF